MRTADAVWPALPLPEWQDTYASLHLWTQIVGKIRLAQTPWTNHSWHVPLYLTARGLTTSPMAYGFRSFEIAFDFVAHMLDIRTSDGAGRSLPLRPQTVADFHAVRTPTSHSAGMCTAPEGSATRVSEAESQRSCCCSCSVNSQKVSSPADSQ